MIETIKNGRKKEGEDKKMGGKKKERREEKGKPGTGYRARVRTVIEG